MADLLLHDIETIKSTYARGSWQRVVFAEFESSLGNQARPFPCVFGAKGWSDNQLRYVFLDHLDARCVAQALTAYLPAARTIGKNTSLVVFTEPSTVHDMDTYQAQFWDFLKDLSALDHAPWPEEIPKELDDAQWEFCFGGEPIFVVCSTPAHVLRQSRRASTLTLTMQPRWVFDSILGTPSSARKSFALVRSRLAPYDAIGVSPFLGPYGDAQSREYAQYFLPDHNEPATCPYATLNAPEAKILKGVGDSLNLCPDIARLLPEQGCLELQQDAPGKVHDWHAHAHDETLVILDGQLHFEAGACQGVARATDVISLPARTRHRSVSGPQGCRYLVAYADVTARLQVRAAS